MKLKFHSILITVQTLDHNIKTEIEDELKVRADLRGSDPPADNVIVILLHVFKWQQSWCFEIFSHLFPPVGCCRADRGWTPDWALWLRVGVIAASELTVRQTRVKPSSHLWHCCTFLRCSWLCLPVLTCSDVTSLKITPAAIFSSTASKTRCGVSGGITSTDLSQRL